MTEPEYLKQKQSLENQLKQNNKGKLKILWAVFVTLASPFLLPYFPTKHSSYGKNFAESMGYWNAVLLFGGILLLIMPYLLYKEYDKMKKNKFDTERELRLLEKEFKS